MDPNKARQEIVEICRRLYVKNFLAAADGNVSLRLSNSEILITPSRRHKGFLDPTEIAVITLSDEVISGKPSSEREMHLAVYRKLPEARCVAHAHPPTAIAWSVARPELSELPAEALSEVILAVGRIPIVPFARPGSVQMGEVILPFIPENRVMILSRHGALSWGESAEEAYWGIERLEHSAQILKAAHELGGVKPLPPDEIKALRDLRKKIGNRIL